MGKTFKDSPPFKFDKVKQSRKFKKTERKNKKSSNLYDEHLTASLESFRIG